MKVDTIYEVARRAFYHDAPPTESEKLDYFRLTLEPYIYHYLIENHSEKLNTFWESYTPPYQAENAFVLVERRPHPNFDFILKNIAWACPTMSVYLFCSDVNELFIRSILGDKAPHFHILPVFKGMGTREQGKREYNHFFTSADSYRMICAKYIMTIQMDVIIRRKLRPFLFNGDYYGNPWGWNKALPGGGGVTIRRVEKMIELCERYGSCGDEVEDAWISQRIVEMGGVVPKWDMAGVICMESIRTDQPFTLHQFWTYLWQYMKMERSECITYWRHLLTLSEEG
jgi:hypothetical protein